MKQAILTVLGLSLCFAAFGETFADGVAAKNNGDNAAAIQIWRDLADQGEARAQDALGMAFFEGLRGVPRDSEEGVKWMRLAAEQGCLSSQAKLGFIFSVGRRVKIDYLEAGKWLHKAAEQGDLDSQTMLAALYEGGLGVSQDQKQAAKYLRMAAEQGDVIAQDRLGEYFYQGLGGPQDLLEAYFWMSLATNLGPEYSKNRGQVGGLLNPAQREEIQARCKKWLEAFEQRKAEKGK